MIDKLHKDLREIILLIKKNKTMYNDLENNLKNDKELYARKCAILGVIVGVLASSLCWLVILMITGAVKIYP